MQSADITPHFPTALLTRPKTCKGAIDRGLELFVEKRHQDAIDMFNMALEVCYRLQY